MNTYTVRQVANATGLSVKTLQRWDRLGKLIAHRAPSGRRLYTEEQLAALLGQRKRSVRRRTVVYLRVSSPAQRSDLVNQRARLEEFCAARGIAVDEWVEEVGGALNFKRPKFLRLMDALDRGEVETIVVAHKDRLARFGFDLLQHLAERHQCELLVMNSETLSPKREMVEDLMGIADCFSARLCGLRNYRKSLARALKSDAEGAQDPA